MSRDFHPAAGPLRGAIRPPGDKSIAHRALILGTLAEGTLKIRHLPDDKDVRSTRAAMAALGAKFEDAADAVHVRGQGLNGLRAPQSPIDCGNSGTTMRLLMGVLAGQPFSSELTGDASLSKRPMGRVRDPLAAMGADIKLSKDGLAPVRITGTKLEGRRHLLSVPSAQVKSALMLAGLYAAGDTSIEDPFATRDHTERMLAFLSAGSAIERSEDGAAATVHPGELRAGKAKSLTIPGDPSSGSFFAAAAALVRQSEVLLRRVLLNPTRLGFFQALKKMGAGIDIREGGMHGREPVGDIAVRHAPLLPLHLQRHTIVSLIDEVPLLALVATQAAGESRFEGVGELRLKESDRLAAILEGISALGGNAQAEGDTLTIKGPTSLKSCALDARGDHRLAMAYAVAALAADGPVSVSQAESAAISYPSFFEELAGLSK